MKKIQSLLLMLMIMFILPIISGCGEEQIRVAGVSFSQGTYTVVQGETVQLEATISPVEADNKSVSYKILSGASYVTVNGSGLVIANTSLGNETRTAQIQVTTDDGKLTATCYISVIPTAIELTAPTGLIYNASSSTLSWDAVTYAENNYSASYNLSVTKDGGTPTLIGGTRVRSYSITESGSYVVKVKSVGDGSVFTDSDYTAEYEFTLLPTPETPTVSNGLITVNKISVGDYIPVASAYQLVVTNVNSTTAITTTFTQSETDTTISWTIPTGSNDILSAGTYQYKVRVLGDGGTTGTDIEYFKSAYSSTTNATFTQLGDVTNILVEDGVMTWNAVANALSYSIYVYTTDLNNPAYTYEDLTTNTWNLPDEILELETYTIKVRAVGNTTNIISGYISVKASQRLETPTNLSISNLTVSWDTVTNATLYKIYINDSTLEVSSNSATSYTFSDSSSFTAGSNTISVVASVADTTTSYVSSEAGTLTVTKLSTPTLTTSSGNIAWTGVSDVNQYYLSLTPASGTTQSFTLSNLTLTYPLGETYGAGIYFATIQAKGDSAEVLDSDTATQQQYTKMSAPIISAVTENGLLSWTKGTYASSSNTFQVIIRDPTGVASDVVLATTGLSYSVGQYLTGSGYGKYYFIIKAVNNLSTQKYLTSGESSGATTYKLSSPTGLTIADGKLSWTAIGNTVEGVNISSLFDYKIKIGTDETQSTPNTSLIPSSASCYAGTHTAWVKARILSTVSNQIAIGEITAYLIGSDYSTSLSFTKLATPSVPTIADEEVSGTIISGVNSYSLTITKPSSEQIAYSVSASSSVWRTTVSNIFDSIGTVSAGTYTIKVQAKGGDLAVDSDLSSSLTIYKLSSPTLTVSDGEIQWNLVYSNLYGNLTPITSYKMEIRENVEGVWSDWSVYIPETGDTSWTMTNYEAGTYQVRITANGSSSRILSSQASSVLEIEKLESVDIGTLAIDQTNEQYDTLTWTEITDASYAVSVYQVYTTTTVLKETTTVAVNTFDFSEDYTVTSYLISVQTVGDGKISGDTTNLFSVTRLSQVTGISIASNGDISWDSVTNANKYLMYINGEIIPDSQVNSTTRVAKLLSGSNPILTSSDTGTLSIQLIAVINGATYSTPVNGAITISGAPSVEYNVFRYVSPTLSITNGNIVWNNSNSNNYGYELTFTTEGLPTTIPIAQNVNTYNMSALPASTNYAVSIKAIGNGGIYLESPTGDLENTVQKLAEPTYSVDNGILTWTKNTNAQSYKVITSGSGKTITTIDLKPISSNPTVVELPASSVAGMSGAIAFTIQAIGTGSITGTGTVYVNSTVSTTNSIYKHATPTGLTVTNGEIYWTRASTRESVINSVSYTVLSGYNVIFGENNEDIGDDEENGGLNEAFILSNYITTKSTLKIQVCSLGNDGTSSSPAGTVYLNSDYTGEMTVVINGRPENLGITSGVLTWTENSQITGTFTDYEILVTKNSTTTSILSTTNSNALDTVTGTITSIQVRHKGTSTSTSGTKYVNSAASDSITNIKKLGTITGAVNTEGEFEWNASNFVFTGYTAGITFTINDISDGTTGNNSTASTFILDGDYGLDEGETAQLTIKAYAVGSSDATDTDTAGYCYLNSALFNLDAYRFAPVTAFTIEEGLKFTWNVDSYIINTVENDRFMLEFKLGENAGNSEADWQYKMIDDLSEIPLWTLGAYEARISVLSTSANVIRSASVNCDLTEVEPYLFNKFEAGEGTPEYPFIISTTAGSDTVEASTAETKLGYINVIPSSYFKLMEDITLTSKSINDYATNLSSFEDQSNIVYITGGINGNGYTISNYEIYSNGTRTYIWDGIIGQAREGFDLGTPLSASNFYGHSGVICNLNLEISKFDIDFSNNTNQYLVSFFAATSMGGWIVNCDISLASTLSSITVDNIQNDYNIVYGGFVAYMFSAETLSGVDESELFDRDARIMDCSSNVNISLTKASNYLESITSLGGIVGYNYGGSIYNCSNTGTLGGTQVGGIAVYCGKIGTYSEINGEYVYADKAGLISGCSNTANLTSYPIKTSDGDEHRSYSGGIVGTLQYSNMVFCLNTGNMIAINGNYHANEQDFTETFVVMGGLIGQFDSGEMINCLSTSTFTLGDYISANSMSGSGSSQLGGLIGDNTSGTFSYSYYDKTLSNYTEVGGVTGNNSGKTTVELQDSSFVATYFLGNVGAEIGEYYDDAFGLKPVFVYVSGSYPALSWIAI